MVSRIVGALARALLVGILFSWPVFVVPGVAATNGSLVATVALGMFIWTYVEYASNAPSLIEFREAPPFNRIRYTALLATVACVSLIQAYMIEQTTMNGLAYSVGTIIGYSIDFAWSPVRLMLIQFPDELTGNKSGLIMASAGIAYLISLIALITFMAIFYIRRWPTNSGPFNVWMNLPTFTPSASSDILPRLIRDARFNLALGFGLPFLIPGVIGYLFRFVGGSPFNDPYLTIWVIAGWTILPTAMIMRGIAISRVAQMVAAKQQRMIEDAEESGTPFRLLAKRPTGLSGLRPACGGRHSLQIGPVPHRTEPRRPRIAVSGYSERHR